MKFFIVSIFGELIEGFAKGALLGRAIEAGHISLTLVDPRDFTTDKHRTVDDAPYGGGSGMLMMPGPLLEAMEDAEARSEVGRPHRVLLTPQGAPLTQSVVRGLAQRRALTLVCGRYEGVDERARQSVDQEISLGDYVLMGGEVGALALLEAVSRLVPGVLGNPASTADESHSSGLLEYPQFTRPAEHRGVAVPAVLLSGNHAAIEKWRRERALARTRARRPELAPTPKGES